MVHLLLGVIYLAFISLGLPDSLLGSAWPSMYGQLGVPLSYAGVLSMIISAGTIVSSLNSDRLTSRFGPGRVTACSVALTAVLVFSLPLWKRAAAAGDGEEQAAHQALTLRQAAQLPGAKTAVLGFFCYCALEQTAGLWAASYLVLHGGFTAEKAAAMAALFYIGITAGRAACGFITGALGDVRMIRLGQGVILAGVAAMALPFAFAMQAGFVLVGLGCAPIYPSIIHATPARFGAARSQALIGLQMAGAYVGTLLMPPLFGLIAGRVSASWLPVYLLAILAAMFAANEHANRVTGLCRPAKAAHEQA